MDGYKNLIVLNEKNKDGYQPGQEEIIAYGQYLGLTFPQDNKFKPLLRDGLVAPLPESWQACEAPDEQGTIVYRNKITQQITEDHPLDAFYREKIARLKSLTVNLSVQTILQERESWLKESSQLFGPSRGSRGEGDYSLRDQEFINEISEEKSVYDQDEDQFDHPDQDQDPNRKQIIINKAIKTPRIYRRRKEVQKPSQQQLKQRLLNLKVVPSFSSKQIRQKNYPIFQSIELNQKLRNVVQICEKVQLKREELRAIQRERRRKMEYLGILRDKVKLMGR